MTTSRFDLVVRGGHCVTRTDIGVRDGRIEAFGDLGHDAAQAELDARHLHVLPGVIDSQVHFREPGLEHKEDLQTGVGSVIFGASRSSKRTSRAP